MTTLRAFLGLTGYYRRFVKGYANVASPLTDILRQEKFSWLDVAHNAFLQLKSDMANMITLALSNFKEEFEVTTDASGTAIGAVLSQKNNPIAFFSKKLWPTMQNQSTYTKELFAITEAVKKWRQYLLGHHFYIYTDHHSLKHILTQAIQTLEQQKWLTKLMGYDFEVRFKPGKENVVADSLSRIEHPSLFAISFPQATWLLEIKTYFADNKDGKEMVHSILTNKSSFPYHETLLEHARIIDLLKEAISKSQERMIKQANKKRIDKEFAVGDMVYLKLQPYRQKSVVARRYRKLSKPMKPGNKVLEKVGKVAYRLELPVGSRIDPVFHVSLLKQSYETTTPLETLDWQDHSMPDYLPRAILQTRVNTAGTEEFLVQWESKPLEEATWETRETMRTDYPFFNLDNKDIVGSSGRGDDTSSPATTHIEPHKEAQDPSTIARPKRKITKPSRFEELASADLVLGESWLGYLGRLSADFSIPEISFKQNGVEHTFVGEPMSHQISSSSVSSILRQGKENVVADSLSRIEHPSLFAISFPQATWLLEIKTYFADNKDGKEMVHSILTNKSSFPYHEVRNGLVFIKGRIFVPPLNDIRQRLLGEYHATPLGGHRGYHGNH
nr:retrotransposable element Tf2 [Tanacetum cinerariifolium]